MTLKIETAKIPDTNSNHVKSFEEYNINGKITRNNTRNFVVPDDKTDEFVKKYKKTEKVSGISMLLTGLAGFFGAGALGMQSYKKYPKIVYLLDSPIYAALFGAIIGAAIPYQITQHKEKKLLQECNAVEIKNPQK